MGLGLCLSRALCKQEINYLAQSGWLPGSRDGVVAVKVHETELVIVDLVVAQVMNDNHIAFLYQSYLSMIILLLQD